MPHAPQTYLITGANRGIGLRFAQVLSARGDKVLATARDPEKAADLSRVPGIQVFPLDVASENSIETLKRALNGRPIDVLINNAGISGKSKTIQAMTAADVAATLLVNSIAPMLVAKAMLPSLRAGSRKTMVHVTSILGSIERNSGGSTYDYRASKAALNMLNRSLAHELRPEGFTTIAIHPGWVKTDMGGPNADLTVEQSVDHMLRTISGLTPDRTGAFLNYDGTPIPW